MFDSEDQRKATQTWSEYFNEMRESYRVYGWVWRELMSVESKRWYKRMMLAFVFEVGFAMTVPLWIAMFANGLDMHEASHVITGGSLMIGAMILERIAAHFVMSAREWILGYNQGEVIKRSSELFYAKSLGQHSMENSELCAANVDKGIERVVQMQNLLLFEGIGAIMVLLISLVLLWTISLVGGLIMTGLFMIILSWSMFMNLKVAEKMTAVDTSFRALNRYRVDTWNFIQRVKVNIKEKSEVKNMMTWYDQVISQDRPFWLWYIKNLTGRGVIGVLAVCLIIGYGAWMIWHGSWEIGVLFPLVMWSNNVRENIWRIGHIEQNLNWNMPSVRSMMNALTMEPDIVDKPDAVELDHDEPLEIEFRNVSFDYKGQNGKKPAPVVKNVSFTIKPGQKVALIGESGCGKSTLMSLLLRAKNPRRGSVRINGHDLRDIKLASWLTQVGHIHQVAEVFDGTIRSNLLYGLSEEEAAQVTDEELWALMRRLEIDFGARLDEGLETKVGRNGIQLSGGQQQRLMIGAAAIKRPRFMAIDEATSSLDATTERKVHEGLREILTDDMCALMITHRLATARDCDLFVVMRPVGKLKNGDPQVEAVAKSFEELYQVSPTFRAMADEQDVKIEA